MKNLPRILLAALALPALAASAACTDDDAPQAEFASLTEDEAATAIEVARFGGAIDTMFVFATLSDDPAAACPRVERDGDVTTLVGDGCTVNGATITGRAIGVNAPTLTELFEDDPDGDISYDFQNFSIASSQAAVTFDGTAAISDPSAEPIVFETNMTLTDDGAPLVIDHRFECTEPTCDVTGTIEATFGAFEVSGTLAFPLSGGGSLRLEGADVLTVDFVEDECVTYQVDGADAGTYCPDDVLPEENLTLPSRARLLRAHPLLHK